MGLGLIRKWLGITDDRKDALRDMDAYGGRMGNQAGLNASRSATARGIQGGYASALDTEARNKISLQTELAKNDLKQRFSDQDMQAIMSIATLMASVGLAPMTGGGSLLGALMAPSGLKGLGQTDTGPGMASIDQLLQQLMQQSQQQQYAHQAPQYGQYAAPNYQAWRPPQQPLW